MNEIKRFMDLRVWNKAHKLVLRIYKITKNFPKNEIFGLVSQMRRCSVSVTSNIAEGFNRRSYKEKVNFYYISLGSISELQSQMLISRDINYLKEKEFKNIFEKSINIHKMLNSLIKILKSHYS
jgi:four helix bundle protein